MRKKKNAKATLTKTVAGSGLFALGFIMVGLVLLSPYIVQDQILVTVERLNKGMPLKEVMPTINGFLAGGSLQSMPTWMMHMFLVMGFVLCYVGCFTILNRNNPGATLKRVFSLEYWKTFSPSFSLKTRK